MSTSFLEWAVKRLRKEQAAQKELELPCEKPLPVLNYPFDNDSDWRSAISESQEIF